MNETGGAVYSIPIQVPPGIAGMELKLALTYSSQAGIGLLGVGWKLEGLSAITRCPSTPAQDPSTSRRAVTYSQDDRFCLDGQRLMVFDGQTYGAAGSEYRTERDVLSKITASGVTISYDRCPFYTNPNCSGSYGVMPQSFTVKTKAGLTMEYGTTEESHSRVQAKGISTIRMWALNKVSDTKGNYLTITYTQDSLTGDFWPVRTDYTGNAAAGVAPFASVRFTDEGRTDVMPLYVAGSLLMTARRISNIKTYVGETVVKDYRLAYDNGGPMGRSRLISVKECDSGTYCLPLTTFGWNPQPSGYDGALGYSSTFNPSDGWFTTDLRPRVWLADVNGDGLPDVLGLKDGEIWVQLNSVSGFVNLPVSWGTNGFAPEGLWFTSGFRQRVWLTDVTGDGLPDLLGLDSNNICVQKNTGSGFEGLACWPNNHFNPNTGWFTTGFQPRVWLSDVNGDGLPDLVGIDGDSLCVQLNTGWGFANCAPWGSGTTYFSTNGGWFTTSLQPRVWLADMNGDGLPDLVGTSSGNVYVEFNTGSGFRSYELWASTYFNTDSGWFTTTLQPRVWLTDVNGDGLPDFVGTTSGTTYVELNNGKRPGVGGLETYANWGPTYFNTDSGWFRTDWQPRVWFTDVNGDGLPDLLGLNGGSIYVELNTGSGFQYCAGVPWGSTEFSGEGGWFTLTNHPRVWPTDAKGDGSTALLGIKDDYVVVHAWTGPSGYAPWTRVTSITGGLGALTNVVYKPLTQPSVYTKDSGAVYPLADLQTPMYAVSSVSASDGISGMVATNYAYGGLKLNWNGRGVLGFRWIQATDVQSGIKLRTEFKQDWPYTGMPSLVKKSTAGDAVILSQVTNTYNCRDYGQYDADPSYCTVGAGKHYITYVGESVQVQNDLNGAPLPTVTTTNGSVDDFGNVAYTYVSASDGHSTLTINDFGNDPSNWILGRLTRSRVTKTSP